MEQRATFLEALSLEIFLFLTPALPPQHCLNYGVVYGMWSCTNAGEINMCRHTMFIGTIIGNIGTSYHHFLHAYCTIPTQCLLVQSQGILVQHTIIFSRLTVPETHNIFWYNHREYWYIIVYHHILHTYCNVDSQCLSVQSQGILVHHTCTIISSIHTVPQTHNVYRYNRKDFNLFFWTRDPA